ncbi:MerR family transcriptional regulator [Cohnella mopanensis]|uniref:MerR family transcriptional regulator n=1 Tax=Cohnella mopanensis TaxID=2911966 RepID=UPI001EF7EC27|nr:MerR family transcriptional regulator [Cohnella mopanensis]
MSEQNYSIGEVSTMTGATVKTIRYYDEIGLLRPAKVTESGFRYYTELEIWELELILGLRHIGYSIKDIRSILHNDKPVSVYLDWQIDALDRQIDHLQELKAVLEATRQSASADNMLDYIREITRFMNKGIGQKKEFIRERIDQGIVGSHTPETWKEQMLTALLGYLPDPVRLTKDQYAAWMELLAMLEDQGFRVHVERAMSMFYTKTESEQVTPSDWQSSYLGLAARAEAAMHAGLSRYAEEMRAIAAEYVSLLSGLKLRLTSETATQFLQRSEMMNPPQVQRYWSLIRKLSPKWELHFKALEAIKQTIIAVAANDSDEEE